ncbi:MAG: sensor histidine kinase [Alphaproteobacteria bacterium]|nr:sensor histidine kinase [Alphaproteobacteria bacterium]
MAGFLLAQLFRTSVERNFDARLQSLLDGLLANVELGADGKLVNTRPLPDAQFTLPLSGWYWQVSSQAAGGEVQSIASESLLEQRLPVEQSLTASRAEGGVASYYLQGPDGKTLRVVDRPIQVSGSEQVFTILVAGDEKVVAADVAEFNRTLIIALAILAFGLALAAFVQVRYGLGPLRSLSDGLIAVRAGKAKSLEGGYPNEIQPVADELNLLLENNDEVVERARTQVGNLAHALKTPLSVLANEADLHPGELGGKVTQQIGLMRDQVNMYLDRARRAARARTLTSSTNVEPVLDSLARTLQRINLDKNIDVNVVCSENARFRGEKQDLEEMIGNLLENAFKFAKSQIDLRAIWRASEMDEGRVWLDIFVSDDGPGLTPQQRHEALKRGHRIDESKPGSGLGLSIVSETAGMYGGKIKLGAAELGGLEVKLKIPAVAD